MKRLFFCIDFLLLLFLLVSCSSTPKRPMAFTTSYQRAANRYERANNFLLVGDFEGAGEDLAEAYNIATSIDRADLLAKICLSAANYRLNLKNNYVKRERFADKTVEGLLDEAQVYAQWAEDAVTLAAVNVYKVKFYLQNGETDFPMYKKMLGEAEKPLASNKYFTGYLYRTQGDVDFAKADYASAASYYLKAAELHTKERYLYEISVDWYYAARAYSYAGNKAEAVNAILKALQYDRAAENSLAIMSDYRAYAKILRKGNPSIEEMQTAREAEKWAEEISAALMELGGVKPKVQKTDEPPTEESDEETPDETEKKKKK